MKCEGCKKEIADNEAMATFSPKRSDDTVYMHHCCLIDSVLFETFGALVLGMRYDAHCAHEHERKASTFELKFLSRELSRATSKLLVTNKNGIDPETVKMLRAAGFK